MIDDVDVDFSSIFFDDSGNITRFGIKAFILVGVALFLGIINLFFRRLFH